MRTELRRTGALVSVLCVAWGVAQAPAFAAGGYHPKPPTLYRGRCELTSPTLPSRPVGDHCVAVSHAQAVRLER